MTAAVFDVADRRVCETALSSELSDLGDHSSCVSMSSLVLLSSLFSPIASKSSVTGEGAEAEAEAEAEVARLVKEGTENFTD